MYLFINVGFKAGSFNECPQSLPVTLYLYIWLEFKKFTNWLIFTVSSAKKKHTKIHYTENGDSITL